MNFKMGIVGLGVGTLLVLSQGATAFAGEIKGTGQPTPIESEQPATPNSLCAYSGLDDAPFSPGETQTPGNESPFPGAAQYGCSKGHHTPD